MKKVFVSTLLLSFISIAGNSQDHSLISKTLKNVQQQQVVSDSYFLKGIFPSYLSKYPEYWITQKDNNVFYNALISYTLNSLKSNLSSSDQIIVEEIKQQNQFLLPHFENRKGRDTYNFSRTDTVFQFPYNKWIPLLRGNLAFPDDLDCTSLVMMSQNATDSTLNQIHHLMQEFTNKGKLKTTYRSYRNDKAYSSWFGKKFPVVLDVSVLCNILCFVQQNNLKWTGADSASLKLIVKTINSNDYVKHPLFVSPYYGKSSIILYHLARLMSIKPIEELEGIKEKLVEEASKEIGASKSNLEKIILNISLMKWGSKPVLTSIHINDAFIKDIHESNFCFFIGNIPSYMRQPLKGLLTEFKILQYYYYCSAFNDVLLLEYLTLLKKTESIN